MSTSRYFENDFAETKINAIKSTISLFKAVPIFGNCNEFSQNFSQEENIKHGFVFSEKAVHACFNYITNEEIYNHTKKEFGYDVEGELNNGFYKNFNTVIKSTELELYLNQIIHYISTYGFMSDGVYSNGVVCIPNEKINIPKEINSIKITVINALEIDDIRNKVLNLLTSGIALSSATLYHLTNIILYFKFDIDIDSVKNKEMKMILCEKLDLIPSYPKEFLHFLVYLSTHSTLLIKNKLTFTLIRNYSTINNNEVLNKFKAYLHQENGIEKLASIFLRFKPLFLAFKTPCGKELNSIINKINKLSHKYHKSVEPKFLETISTKTEFYPSQLKIELKGITNFKKISIVNGLRYRLQEPDYILYSIRNGLGYVKDFTGSSEYLQTYQQYINAIIQSIVDDIKPKVNGKKIHIPEDLTYMAPTSEKKFFGCIPFGSYYSFKSKNTVIGVHWLNILNNKKEEINVDLDLRFQSETRDIGWNNHFYGNNHKISKNAECVFSGDMTTALIDKGGAVESYYVSEKMKNEFATLTLHFYNLSTVLSHLDKEKYDLPFELIIDDAILDKVTGNEINRELLIDPRTITFSLPNIINNERMTIGFLRSDEEGNKRFYFSSIAVGKGRVSHNDKYIREVLDYTQTYLNSCLTLKELLTAAGAIFEKEEDEEWDIDLDPLKLTKDQLIELFM